MASGYDRGKNGWGQRGGRAHGRPLTRSNDVPGCGKGRHFHHHRHPIRHDHNRDGNDRVVDLDIHLDPDATSNGEIIATPPRAVPLIVHPSHRDQ